VPSLIDAIGMKKMQKKLSLPGIIQLIPGMGEYVSDIPGRENR